MKTPFTKRKKMSEEMSLQITSMADIFTIILVFLLKSFSTNLTTFSPSDGISLPEGKSEGKIQETLKMEITPSSILVDQKPILSLKNFEFADQPKEDDEVSPEVLNVLSQQRKLLPEPNMDSTLIVMADEKMPYSTLKRVLASAATAGFVDLQLVVVSPE